jgi:hypothetical protein
MFGYSDRKYGESVAGPETWHLAIKIFEPCLVLDFNEESLIGKGRDDWTDTGLNSENEGGRVKCHAGWKGLAI